MIRFLTAFALLCWMLPSIGSAGTVVEFEVFAYDPTLEGGKGVMYFDKSLVRIETKLKSGTDMSIYRIDEGVMWQISPDESKYSVLTTKKANKVHAKLLDWVEQVEGQLQSMPKEERDRLMKERGARLRFMRKMVEENSHKDMSYEKVESGVKIGTYTCDKYKLLYKGKFNDVEHWIADWAQVGAIRDDFAACARAEEQFGVFGKELTLFTNIWSQDMKNPVDGFPIRTLFYDGNSKSIKIDVTGVRHEDLDPKLFELPSNLEEVPFMGVE